MIEIPSAPCMVVLSTIMTSGIYMTKQSMHFLGCLVVAPVCVSHLSVLMDVYLFCVKYVQYVFVSVYVCMCVCMCVCVCVCVCVCAYEGMNMSILLVL